MAVIVSANLVGLTPGPNDDAADGVGVSLGLARFDVADRKDAPTIEGLLVSGDGVASISHPGKVVVVNVWQSTCAPCRGDAEALETAACSTTRDATFVGLDVVDRRADARAFLASSSSSCPHIFDPDARQLRKFNGILPVHAVPSTAVIDRKGRIAARIIGPVSAQTLIQLIDEVSSST